MRFEDEPVPGYPLPILPGHTSPGRLERVLRSGGFAITSELDPPDSADPEDVYRRARVFDGYVDAINATDGSGANCHMSSLAVCALLTRVGYAPVMQISLSGMLAPAPAPVSTTRAWPRATSFLTVSGEAATRRSPARRSRGIAIFKGLAFV